MFAMAKLMEMETTEQNKVAVYLFNNIVLSIVWFAILCKVRYDYKWCNTLHYSVASIEISTIECANAQGGISDEKGKSTLRTCDWSYIIDWQSAAWL